MVWPVQYRCHRGTIVFRLPAGAYDGTALTDLAFHANGVDDLGAVERGGDRGRDITDSLELLSRQIGRLGLGPPEADRGPVIELWPSRWSGRRFSRPA